MLPTPRLLLLPLSRAVLERRCEEEAFTLACSWPGTDQTQNVHFPPEWPGDPLPAFPLWLAALTGEAKAGSFIAVTREEPTAAGMLGTKGAVSAGGAVEIGYGFTPQHRGQGYATEAVHALTLHLLGQPGIRAVTAQTAVGNRASERVLEKVGFARVGRHWDDKDGALTFWSVEL